MPAHSPNDAIELLKQDHREVENLFSQFEDADETERVPLAEQICVALTVHAQVEEELFYPAAKEALAQQGVELVAEAEVEHNSLKQLIGEINGSSPEEEAFEARLTVLKEYVQHHVREEEEKLMPMVRSADVDLEDLGERISDRKSTLMEGMLSKTSASKKKPGRVHVPTPSSRAKKSTRSKRATGATSRTTKKKTKRRSAS